MGRMVEVREKNGEYTWHCHACGCGGNSLAMAYRHPCRHPQPVRECVPCYDPQPGECVYVDEQGRYFVLRPKG